MSGGRKKGNILAFCLFPLSIITLFFMTALFGINTLPIVLFAFAAVLVYALSRVTAAYIVGPKSSYSDLAARARDPSLVQRVVVELATGKEHIIAGSPSQTLKMACLEQWCFDIVSKKDRWLIQDEKGNDITNMTLSEYHGIAQIVSTSPAEEAYSYSQEESDATDDYSDMDRGVTYYD